eukprot:CAMPEP_0178402794 /NCGR_PEP_ID=MMETSP0689_2-20121128/17031_1 /TAXON_ID=160604 /ORGANISM="Amphidinium massartii, Strain CS-259" /LENGTH=500 /DNA_ID=CAMNT_0020023717 /DNA_START=18 /DNA_END=1520 /DNA_ORIENTATION=-
MRDCKAMTGIGPVRALLSHSLLCTLLVLVTPASGERPALLEVESGSQLEQATRVNKTELFEGKVIFFARSRATKEEYAEDEGLDVDRAFEIKKRLNLLKDREPDQYQLLGSVKQVWVAPTISSMMAAMRIVALTPSMRRGVIPKFVVKAGLRPVYASFDFKWLMNLKSQVREYGRQLSREFFATETAFDRTLEQLFTGYDTFRSSEMQETRAQTSLQVLSNIRSVKSDLQVERLDAVLMVADRFVGSWLFMCALPPLDSPKGKSGATVLVESEAEDNLRTLARSSVKGFAKSGVAVATWEIDLLTAYPAGTLYPYDIDDRYVTPFFKSFDLCDNVDEPNFRNFEPFYSDIHSSIKVLPFDDSGYISREAQAARQNVPADAVWTRFMMKKKKVKKGYSTNENRIVSVAYGTSTVDETEKLAYVTWADEYGVPQGFIKLAEADVQKEVQAGRKGGIVARMTSTSGKAWILSPHPTSEEEVVDKFIAAFTKAKTWLREATVAD